MDTYSLEKELANKSTRILRAALRNAIKTTSVRRSGLALRAGSRAAFKDRRLQRLIIKAPHYVFKQHYGFEGAKSNGVNMRLAPTDVLTKAVESSDVLETLIDGIAQIRTEQVIAAINFTKDGKKINT